MTFSDVLRRSGEERVPLHEHDGSEISGDATYLRVTASAIYSGTIQGETITIAGGIDGIIQSDNYAAGAAGWAIFGDGTAEFNDVIVRGDIVSSNWTGADPVDLSAGADVSADTGFALDASAGAAQFQELYLVGGGGTVMSILPGVVSSNAGIEWLPTAVTEQGTLYMGSSNTGSGDFGRAVISTPSESGAPATSLILDSETISGGDGEVRVSVGAVNPFSIGPEYVKLPVKTTTGDPTGDEGRMYVNTADNALRLYADGAWRSVTTW